MFARISLSFSGSLLRPAFSFLASSAFHFVKVWESRVGVRGVREVWSVRVVVSSRKNDWLLMSKSCLVSGDQRQVSPMGARSVILLGSLENPIGRSTKSIIHIPTFSFPLSAGFVPRATPYAIFVLSGDKTGFIAPVKVRADKEGAAGKRKASILVTSSSFIVICLSHVWYPSFLSVMSYSLGGREIVALVADSSSLSTKICAPSGLEVTTNNPRGLRVRVFESKR